MKSEDKKIRKNIMLSPDLNLHIKEAAGKYGTSESSVIEKALVNYLGEEPSKELPEFFGYEGACDCEHPTLSVSYKRAVKRRAK